MLDERVELKESVTVEKDVEKRVKTVGIRGLDMQKARELGVFQRISYLLCVMHSSVMAAYRIYGDVDCMLSDFGGRKNEISKAMGDFEKAFDRFVGFWTDYYVRDGDAWREVGNDTESLFHNIMRWASLPETWQLGERQRLDDKLDVAISMIDEDGDRLTFNKCVVNEKVEGESHESWCVTKYDKISRLQTVVNSNMDKASAMMVAKRLSNDDERRIYTANLVRDVVERRTEITPYKSYKGNQAVGTIKKKIKK